MRLEATVPDSRGAALRELAEELGLSKSQVVDEALSLFLMAVMEIRRGRRFISIGDEGERHAEVITPTLAQLRWMFTRGGHGLSSAAAERIERLVESPPAPTDALRETLADAP